MVDHEGTGADTQRGDAEISGKLRNLAKGLRLGRKCSTAPCRHNLASHPTDGCLRRALLRRADTALEKRLGAGEERKHKQGTHADFLREKALRTFAHLSVAGMQGSSEAPEYDTHPRFVELIAYVPEGSLAAPHLYLPPPGNSAAGHALATQFVLCADA